MGESIPVTTTLTIFLFQECNIEEAADEEEPPPSKSSKDKKANGPDSGKATSFVFKLTSKVPYKTVLKGIVFLLDVLVVLVVDSCHLGLFVCLFSAYCLRFLFPFSTQCCCLEG